MTTLSLFKGGTIILGISYKDHPDILGVFSIDEEKAAEITPESKGEIKKGKLYIDGNKVDATTVNPPGTEPEETKEVELSEEEKEKLEKSEKEGKILAIKEELKGLVIQREIAIILDEDPTETIVRIELLKGIYKELTAETITTEDATTPITEDTIESETPITE